MKMNVDFVENSKRSIKHVLSVVLDEYLERKDLEVIIHSALNRKGEEVLRVTSEHIELPIPMFQYLKIKEFNQGWTTNGNYYIGLDYRYQGLGGGSNGIRLVDIRLDPEGTLNAYWIEGDIKTYWAGDSQGEI